MPVLMLTFEVHSAQHRHGFTPPPIHRFSPLIRINPRDETNPSNHNKQHPRPTLHLLTFHLHTQQQYPQHRQTNIKINPTPGLHSSAQAYPPPRPALRPSCSQAPRSTSPLANHRSSTPPSLARSSANLAKFEPFWKDARAWLVCFEVHGDALVCFSKQRETGNEIGERHSRRYRRSLRKIGRMFHRGMFNWPCMLYLGARISTTFDFAIQ
ncbi:hypothetical protein BJ508DRAFT_37624 [Ascobolus immersus RN42]|uniref:Uncharacterized protein n=1 Tax=Ascobolus immersus RN42 TaxID=1160509 RepID=A0A3N4IFK1_ASCIM|nr:hypothetical protein BJ508DRAFT_37624 [Ascobolus immersus RN42]